MTKLFSIQEFGIEELAFLVFYCVLGIVGNLFLKYLHLKDESCIPAARQDCTDPYEIAALRGEANETMRIVLFSLIDRGLLKASDTTSSWGPFKTSFTMMLADPRATEMVSQSVERAVISFFLAPRTVEEFFSDTDTMDAGKKLCQKLADEGLMANRRLLPDITALALLMLVTAIIDIAVIQKIHEGWLGIMCVIFFYWIIIPMCKTRTGAGEKVFQRVRLRFNHLKQNAKRVRPGGVTNDATILAAIFGLGALPSDNFQYIRNIFRKGIKEGTNGGCGGGCGGCG